MSRYQLCSCAQCLRVLRLTFLVPPVAGRQLPIDELRAEAAERAAGPGGAERCEQAPAVVFVGDARCDRISAGRCLGHAVATEGRAGPQAGLDLADLGHPVQGVAHDTGPGILDFQLTELRIDREDV